MSEYQLLGNRRKNKRRRVVVFRQFSLGFAVLALAAYLFFVVGYSLDPGFAGLSGDNASAREVGYDVLILTVLSGVVAAAVTEFLKRVLPLRELFNRSAVWNFMGELSDFNSEHKGTEEVPLFSVPPTYGAPLSQLCAQLGQTLALLAKGVGEQRGDKRQRDLLLEFLFDGPDEAHEVQNAMDAWSASPLAATSTVAWSETDAPDQFTSTLLVQAERQLDAFQLRTRAQWHRMLQWVSAGSAAAFMLCVGFAVQAGAVETLGAGLLGLVIGGPVAWAVRDLLRLVERRAG